MRCLLVVGGETIEVLDITKASLADKNLTR